MMLVMLEMPASDAGEARDAGWLVTSSFVVLTC